MDVEEKLKSKFFYGDGVGKRRQFASLRRRRHSKIIFEKFFFFADALVTLRSIKEKKKKVPRKKKKRKCPALHGNNVGRETKVKNKGAGPRAIFADEISKSYRDE